MFCRFCNQNRKLIKAHIIPESFFRPLRKGEKPPRLLSAHHYPKKSPIGVYDKTILCESCEEKFGVWDDYAQEILLKKFHTTQALQNHGDVYGYVYDDYDYSKLKLFFISMLWRASVSTRRFYSNVNLGGLEAIAKSHIQMKNPGTLDEFSVILARFDEQVGKLSILDPHLQQLANVNFYQFYMTGFIAYIKVDNQLLSGSLSKFIMSPEKVLPIIRRNFYGSIERTILTHIVENAKL